MTLYCRVTRGGLGVEVASVEATVEVLTPEGGLVRVVLQLQDDGWGEPDLEEGDGVYSGVMTEYPSVGRYIVLLRVVEEGKDRAPPSTCTPCPPPAPCPPGCGTSVSPSTTPPWRRPRASPSCSLLYSTTLASNESYRVNISDS